jgi:hypothetical protein
MEMRPASDNVKRPCEKNSKWQTHEDVCRHALKSFVVPKRTMLCHKGDSYRAFFLLFWESSKATNLAISLGETEF